MSTAQKTLAQMTAEVVEVNRANGWYDKDVLFAEAMALTHSEVSAALDAWRKRGLTAWKVRKLERVTACQACQQQTDMSAPECPDHPDKPEGVPSEFADVFIRLLDYAYRFGQIDLDEQIAASHGQFGLSDSFPANMNMLHTLITLASMRWQDEFVTDGEAALGMTWQAYFGKILVFLRQLCELYEIDLAAEYAKKMAFNRTRPYRHGNRRI